MSILANYSTRLFLFCFLVAGIFLLGLSPAQAEWYKDEQAIMGTSVRVELWHEDHARALKAIQAVMDEMRHIDDTMSPYKPDSELSRINRKAAKEKLVISDELFQLITTSLKFSELTHGAFDITFASVGRFYNFRKHQRPNAEELKTYLPKISYRHILLDDKDKSIHFSMDGVYIDLGGIAKGYAVDRSIALLQSLGVKHAIVTAGGDSRIIGDRMGRPWMVGIRDPRKSGAVSGVIPLTDSALSTSGDYERYFIENGQHYHHILNPGTGDSARELRSVSVLGPDATTTDALSTSIFVLGLAKGLELIESLPDIEAVIIDQAGKMHYSSGLLSTPERAPTTAKKLDNNNKNN